MTERQHERANLERQVRPENATIERFLASTEQATKSMGPMVTSVARANMELVSLAGKRAQAYLDLPNTVAQCRGFQDLLTAQVRFWQTAFEDYSACNRRVVAALSAQNAVTPAAQDAGNGRRERDTITFPDVFGFAPWALTESAQRRRDEEDRAA